MVSRRAAYIAYPQAIPQKALIERPGTSPCTHSAVLPASSPTATCRSSARASTSRPSLGARLDPAGRESGPRLLRAVRGRVHPGRPRRAAADPQAQALHRRHPLPDGGRRVRRDRRREPQAGGSDRFRAGGPDCRLATRPAGITRSRFSRPAAEPGGLLRLAIPDYRLPADVVERDIANVTALGVQIATNTRGRETSTELQARRLRRDSDGDRRADLDQARLPGEDLDGVRRPAWSSSARSRGGRCPLRASAPSSLGGGNVARSRHGRRADRPAARRARSDRGVPARPRRDAGATWKRSRPPSRKVTRFQFQVVPVEVVGDEQGGGAGLRCIRDGARRPDTSGRRRPEPVPGASSIGCESVITAAGLDARGAGARRGCLATADDPTWSDLGRFRPRCPTSSLPATSCHGALDIAHAVGRGQRAAS